jgi:parallel beta-helix repeat protein
MTRLGKTSTIAGTANLLLFFLLTGVMPYDQQQLHYFNLAEAQEAIEEEEEGAEEEEEEVCIDYDSAENTIAINCDGSFLDVVQAINDDPEILEDIGSGEYLLNANLEVADGVTFEMNSNDDGLQYLKIAGANGIIVQGRIEISGIIITSWDTEANSPIFQTITGSVPRAFINLRESEGGFVHNSEIAYLGYQEFGRRGFDLFGDGPSHDLEIRGSKFHNMWFAFYSRGAYNIVVDGNEYYDNIKYALDPHSGTHHMSITNNYLHHNPIGVICSDRCYNILIEGNRVEHNTDHGIFFSRNMYNSIARNNYVFNTPSGITVSESPNNQIYNNTIEGATRSGIRLFNPELPDDGVTEGNLVYNNIISSSEDGISAARSNDNILENNMFSNIQSSEYSLSGDSSIIIRGQQQFDNALMTAEGSATRNIVEIRDSGIIEVTEINDQGISENNFYNTDDEPYRKRLSNGDNIIINS